MAAVILSSPPSPSPSLSLLEAQEQTRLVLGAFLGELLSVPVGERPGRVGGAYRDYGKLSTNSAGRKAVRDGCDRQDGRDDGWDSLDEKISVAEQRKHGITDMIKKRLRPRSRVSRHSLKGAGKAEPNPEQLKDSQLIRNKKHDLSVASPSSSSADEGNERKEDKKKKKKKKNTLRNLSSFIQRIRVAKPEPPASDDAPKRPNLLPVIRVQEPEEAVTSPSRSPQFYEGVAETLGKIARRQSEKRRSPPIAELHGSQSANREEVIQDLVRVLSAQGDALDSRIQQDPILQRSLTRLSYRSFASMLDIFAGQTAAEMPPPASPTLSRIAATMELSRRVITATGNQRMKGYAEQYMENFAPWVKNHGGWENIVQFEEYD